MDRVKRGNDDTDSRASRKLCLCSFENEVTDRSTALPSIRAPSPLVDPHPQLCGGFYDTETRQAWAVLLEGQSLWVLQLVVGIHTLYREIRNSDKDST